MRTEQDLYDVLEKALKASSEPLDCALLYDMDEVRQFATSVNRVSDYLGNMWRRGDVTRLPAPNGRGTRARWMYMWKGRATPKPDLSLAVSNEPAVLLNKPAVKITESGSSIVIDLPNLSITIKAK